MTQINPGDPVKLNPHFFKRERDGSVRLRIRFSAEEAALIEEAAADTPVLLYIHRVLGERARHHIAEARTRRERQARSTNPQPDKEVTNDDSNH
jgi:hypothetical protein